MLRHLTDEGAQGPIPDVPYGSQRSGGIARVWWLRPTSAPHRRSVIIIVMGKYRW